MDLTFYIHKTICCTYEALVSHKSKFSIFSMQSLPYVWFFIIFMEIIFLLVLNRFQVLTTRFWPSSISLSSPPRGSCTNPSSNCLVSLAMSICRWWLSSLTSTRGSSTSPSLVSLARTIWRLSCLSSGSVKINVSNPFLTDFKLTLLASQISQVLLFHNLFCQFLWFHKFFYVTISSINFCDLIFF